MVSTTAFATLFERAVQCHRAGQVAEAEGLYREVLALDPGHHPSLHLLSTLALQAKRPVEAAALLERATALAPDNAIYHANLGETYRRLGQLPQAAETLVRALSIQPDMVEATYNLALVLETNEELGAAIAHYQRAADLKPGVAIFEQALARALVKHGAVERAIGHLECIVALDPSTEALEALAMALDQSGRAELAGLVRAGKGRTPETKPRARAVERARGHEKGGRTARAVASYEEALADDPENFEALYALGRFALAAGRSAEAADWLSRAVAAMPGDAAASHRLGLALKALGNPAGLECLERAAALRPGTPEFQIDLAHALRDRGAFERAVGHYHAALACDPGRAGTLTQLGRVLRTLGRPDAAAITLRRALAVDSNCVDALAHLGATLWDLGRIDEAVACCTRAIALDDRCAEAHFQLGTSLAGSGRIDEAIDSWRRTIALDPTNAIARCNIVWITQYSPRFDGPAILHEARDCARRFAEPVAASLRTHENDRSPDRRLRVGYVSADFRNHSAAYFLVPLLVHHDHGEFELYAYSSNAQNDDVTERLRSLVDVWRDVGRYGDASVAELVRQDRIDVLVDLSMHTARGRPGLFARKPAPVQIAWLGNAGTTGLATMDYRITDPYLDPPELGPGPYSEAPLVLPETFWCYDPLGPGPDVGPLPALGAGHVTFGCQNSFLKVHEGVLEVWARVLRAVDASRLIAHAPAHTHARVLACFEALGIDPARVTLVPFRRREEYLANYQQIDVGLDTFPFNGATTSFDAFWMGVPVVTLVGATVAGRAGSCIARNLNLPELVARTPEAFERAAVALATDLDRLAALRSGLRVRLQASPLMDAPRFARHMEAAYRGAWRTWVERR